MQTGDALGPFRIVSELGSGGMGRMSAAGRLHADALALFERIGAHDQHAATAHLHHGARLIRSGSVAEGRPHLERALSMAKEGGVPSVHALVAAHLAAIGVLDAGEAAGLVAAAREQMTEEERGEAHFLLWKATGDRMLLTESKNQLDDTLAGVPAEYRESMLAPCA